MKNKRCEGIDCAWCMNVECPNERRTKMTDEEFMIGIRERLTDNEPILIASVKEFATISIEELEKGIKVKKEYMRFLV